MVIRTTPGHKFARIIKVPLYKVVLNFHKELGGFITACIGLNVGLTYNKMTEKLVLFSVYPTGFIMLVVIQFF